MILSNVLNKKENINSLFIWGDSQAYFGLDLNLIEDQTGFKVYSAAKKAASVYDLLYFSEMTTKKSSVIITISKPCLLRDYVKDRNESGLSFSAIYKLLENNYSKKEILRIIKNNLIFKRLYNNIELDPQNNNVYITDEMRLRFKRYYNQDEAIVNSKLTIYFNAIRNLKEKQCKISFIQFPYHDDLCAIEEESLHQNLNNDLLEGINLLFPDCSLVDIHIDNSQHLMRDLTHLNALGARMVSSELCKYLNNDYETRVFKINNGCMN